MRRGRTAERYRGQVVLVTGGASGEHWDRIIAINLTGVVNGLLAVYPRMVGRGRGQIVNTASGAGLAAPPFVAAYAATKHAVVGLSQGLRPEARSEGAAGPRPPTGLTGQLTQLRRIFSMALPLASSSTTLSM